jgi:uncharacterized protein (UPF0335 family)
MDRVQLKSFVDRIERLEEEQRAIGSDKRDVYGEVKSAGYNTKALRKIIAERRQKDREQIEADMEAYRVALGMAVEAVSNGDTSLRRAAKQFGVSKSAIHRLVPREEKSASGTPPHDEQTGEIRDALNLAPDSAPERDMSSASPSDCTGEVMQGESNEIHRGAMQPKGCAKVVRTEPSMSGSVAASGDAVRDASAMPLDVVAAPHSEGREHAGSAATVPPACSITDDDPGPIPHFLRRPKQEEASI